LKSLIVTRLVSTIGEAVNWRLKLTLLTVNRDWILTEVFRSDYLVMDIFTGQFD
jgi:hypothetical protein